MDFLLRHDRERVFRFGSLQSAAGQAALTEARTYAPAPAPDSLMLIEGRRVFWRSTAVLRIAWRLGWPWRGLAIFLLVPRPVRDAIYDWIARSRYRWFGRRTKCRLPTTAELERFL